MVKQCHFLRLTQHFIRFQRALSPTRSFHQETRAFRHSPQVLTHGHNSKDFHLSHFVIPLNYGNKPGPFMLRNSQTTLPTRTSYSSAPFSQRPSSTTKTRRHHPFASSVHVSTLPALPTPLRIPISFVHSTRTQLKSFAALLNIYAIGTRSLIRGRLARARNFPTHMYFPRGRRPFNLEDRSSAS